MYRSVLRAFISLALFVVMMAKEINVQVKILENKNETLPEKQVFREEN